MRSMVMAPLVLLGCQPLGVTQAGDGGSSTSSPAASPAASLAASPAATRGLPPGDSDEAREYRAELVLELAREIRDARVLDAMGRVPRHLFVPGVSLRRAYVDRAAPIGHGQTISQPLVVAIMTEALDLQGRERVLEIGTGSGYQAAILSLLASEVYSIEVVKDLAEEARARLETLGYANVHVRAGDGYKGWPEQAPFDRVIVTAAPEEVPRVLLDELAEGGILVVPVGPNGWSQRLLRYHKVDGRISIQDLGPVAFVPMVPGD
jgi:protein-L-isoaspartate(D-aspartate) O-methyltransferase